VIPATQLLAFGFNAGAAFEGQILGALERLESGGALRVLDLLFVAAQADTGELVAINLEGKTGGLTAKLLDFRLDPAARHGTAERSLEDELGNRLEPGSALALVLVEHVWVRAMEDAVTRVGGRTLASDFVDAATLSELAPDLRRMIAERPSP
jgi:hypothetical protein